MSAGEEGALPVALDAKLVRALLAEQFPQWAELDVRPVLPGGWDNRTFRVGEELSARLPSHAAYAAQVAKEQRYLPALAPQLPLPIPAPVARGAPGQGYPLPWSVLRWLPGEDASSASGLDEVRLARELARFLRALHACDASAGPAPGAHCFGRGGPLALYDAETRRALSALGERVRTQEALALWEAACASAWEAAPRWVHGDLDSGNLLVRDGGLAAVIDFGCCAVGDPACDLVLAWTRFAGESRRVFVEGVELDEPTWLRARGWALWKALITLERPRECDRPHLPRVRALVDELCANGDPGRD